MTRVETKQRLNWMLPETTLDGFIPIDVLWNALGTSPDYDKKWQPQIQMNISDIGDWYPVILDTLGLEDYEIREKNTDPADTYRTISEVLIREDRLYDLVRQKKEAKDIFPTEKPDERSVFESAKKEIILIDSEALGEEAAYDFITHDLSIARERLSEEFGTEPSTAIPLPLFGMVDPRAQRALIESSEFQNISDYLLSAWSFALSDTVDNPYFNNSYLSQRGVGVILNSYLTGIQMRVSLEQVIFDKKRLEEGVLVGDLRIGSPDTLLDEIDHRKEQVKMYVGTAYVNNYVAGKHKVHEGRYATAARHDRLITADKVPVKFFNRYFDPQTGEMSILPKNFDHTDRAEFAEWFLWFGYAAQTLRPEIERRLKRRTAFV